MPKRLPVAISRALGLRILKRFGYDRTTRARNYEIERDLQQIAQRRFVVAEWCPFNDITCDYRKFATAEAKQEFWARALPVLKEKGIGPGEIALWHQELFAPSNPNGLDYRLVTTP